MWTATCEHVLRFLRTAYTVDTQAGAYDTDFEFKMVDGRFAGRNARTEFRADDTVSVGLPKRVSTVIESRGQPL